MTNAGLKELAPLKQLQTLFLGHTLVTDAGLKELAPLTQLQRLDLGITKVTDVGLKELAPLTQLQRLDLDDTGDRRGAEGTGPTQATSDAGSHRTKVTDAGLKELASVKQLQMLNLSYTGVTGTAEGAGSAQAAADAEALSHQSDGRGAEGTGGAAKLANARPYRHQDNGRGVEGTSRTEKLANARPCRHQDNGRGAEGLAKGPAWMQNLSGTRTINSQRGHYWGQYGVAVGCSRRQGIPPILWPPGVGVRNLNGYLSLLKVPDPGIIPASTRIPSGKPWNPVQVMRVLQRAE